MDGASRAGLKALYSDARKRAARGGRDRRLPVHGARAGRAADRPERPAGPGDSPVRQGGVLALSPATEQWLRNGYQQRMNSEAVRRDLGEILAHGEPERGMGQGEAAEQAPRAEGQAFWDGDRDRAPSREDGRRAAGRARPRPRER